MGALFVICRGGTTRLYFGRHMDELALAVFARGPEYASLMASDLPRASQVDVGAAGFLIDHDMRRAVVLDLGVCFDADDARVNGWILGTASRVSALQQLDLTEEESRVLGGVMHAGTTWELWLEALKQAPLADGWREWTLEVATHASFTQEAQAALRAASAPISTRTRESCFAVGTFHEIPPLDEFKRGWYSSCLGVAKEPVLFTGLAAGTSVVRLLVVPSFSSPRVSRLTKRGDAVSLDVFSEPAGSPLVSKKPSPRHPARPMRESTWRELEGLLSRSGFWELPTNEPPRGLDGEQWVIEANIDGRHHVVDRWCPESGGFWELGRFLERLGGWQSSR
jgi:hypothetical protein